MHVTDPDRSEAAPAACVPCTPADGGVDGDVAELDRVLAQSVVRSVFQPIVELATGSVVAYEALARGPVGSALETPDALFAAARRSGRLAELDRVCRQAALSGARTAGLHAPWTLFINVEPATAHDAFLFGDQAEEAQVDAHPGDGALRVVVELTERALTTDPTQLLEVVGRIRARGWGIALDDVGANRDSLALLPILRPDIIKLDLRLIQNRLTAEIAEIVCAVNAEAERSGSAVLAEGIETEQHLEVARGLGATLGQGWMLGRPVALPQPLMPHLGDDIVILSRAEPARNGSPYALAVAARTPKAARKSLLIEVSKYLERQAMQSGEATVVLSTFQRDTFTAGTQRRYARLTDTAAFVGALGPDMPSQPVPGVRGGALADDDPLLEEWDIAVIGPHYAATLVARERDADHDGPAEAGPDLLEKDDADSTTSSDDADSDDTEQQRQYHYVLSHDRELAIAVATAMMSRIPPISDDLLPAH